AVAAIDRATVVEVVVGAASGGAGARAARAGGEAEQSGPAFGTTDAVRQQPVAARVDHAEPRLQAIDLALVQLTAVEEHARVPVGGVAAERSAEVETGRDLSQRWTALIAP